MSANHLAEEWRLLQTQCESYERHSLLIKLAATLLVGASFLIQPGLPLIMGAIVSILWLQDAIWKTFQSRLEARLLLLENKLSTAAQNPAPHAEAFQLHTQFQAQRQRGGTLKQYIAQATRPTVAYPYVALIALLGLTLAL
ncbi:MAG: hypothetical protein AB8G16_14900 [Gammaproteobacteria bacterium]